MVLNTLAQIKALAEPLRYRVFELLTVEARTAKQTAGLMGMKPTRLYHHFGVLEKAGLIRKVKTRKKRGTTEKYYQAVADKIVLDANILGSKVLCPSSIYAGVFHATLEEIVETEQAAADASQEPPILVNRLKIRTTSAKIQALQRKLQEWIDTCQRASSSEGDAEYGVTVAFYQVAENFSQEERNEP